MKINSALTGICLRWKNFQKVEIKLNFLQEYLFSYLFLNHITKYERLVSKIIITAGN